jgi:type IV pilus assembly protein PilV
MRPLENQKGSVLLESLIAILIFSMGILAVVGMQAVAIKDTSQAKFRTDASMFANQLIGQMWADDRTTLQASYNSPGGAKYQTWAALVTNAQTGLPGAAANPPTVVVDGTNTVTVTVRWQSPGESAAHSFVAVAQLN